jgi:hypothetical protein
MTRSVVRLALVLGVFLVLSQAQAVWALRASPPRGIADRLPPVSRVVTDRVSRWMLRFLGRIPVEGEKGGGDCSMGIDPNGKPCIPPPPPAPPCTTCEG